MSKPITVPVTDMAQSTRFYRAALAPLGFQLLPGLAGQLAFGGEQQPQLWLVITKARPQPPLKMILEAVNRDTVRQFFQAGMMAGGQEVLSPALYPECHREDYSALILDPDRHCIKVVCHISE